MTTPNFTVSTNGTNGTASIVAGTGAWSYTPNADYNGSDSFTVAVTDNDGNTETQVINVTVASVVDIAADTDSTDEDTPVTTDVLFNDDFEGTTPVVTVEAGDEPSNGTVVVNGDGTITYTPDANFNGTDQYTYTVTSGGVTETATVDMTVNPVAEDLTQAPTERSQLNDSVDVTSNGQVQTFTKTVDGDASGDAMLQLLMKGNYGSGPNAGITVQIGGTVLGTFKPEAERVDAGVTGQINDSAAVSSYTGKVLAVENANGQQFDITWNLNITLSSTFWDSIAQSGEVTVDITLDNGPTSGTPGDGYFFGYRLVYDAAQQDPLVIDLGEDGISFLPDAVNFDLNDDGAAERSAWTNGQDGLLVVDLDGSGSIESGREVFSPFFGEGGFATSLDALATAYDSNGDGVVDSDDAGFGDIHVWIDTNVDGVSDTNELRSLSALGIEEIDLAVERSDTLINGQLVSATGNVTFADGTTRDYVEVTFAGANTDEATYDANGLPFTVSDSADGKALEIGTVDQTAEGANEIVQVDLGAIHEMAPDLLAEINKIDMANGQKNALIVDADDLLRLVDGNTADANEAIEIKMDVFDTASVEPSEDWTLTQVDQDTLQLEGFGGEFAALGTFATITFVSEETNQA
ncbi:tandem-95 repeat protein, partial [Sulfitobacter sp. JBTF-M27]